MAQKRRVFTNEFRLDAVLLTMQEEKTVKEVAQEMDIPYGLLTKWRSKYKKYGKEAFLDNKAINKQQKDLKALEKELRIIKQERDILKKALAIFSLQEKTNTGL
jgi:transposase